ncbi:hypothetical protein [Baekduia sp. Peel2402]|uniref:hypothetical protein n=1 Tax=Baekduia sp. Peel2402 TaxID=3458296 RepID=UPI00403EC816
MPSTDAPNWWADVQQEREDLAAPGRRPADDWLGEDIDFVPRRRMTRGRDAAGAAPLDERLTAAPATATAVPGADGAAHPLHGVFVPADAAALSHGTSRTLELVSEDDDANARRARAVARAIEQDDARSGARSRSRTIELHASDDARGRTIELLTEADVATAAVDTPAAAVAHELAHLSAADDPFASPPPPAGVRRTIQIKGRPTEAGRLANAAERSMAQRHRGRTTSDRVGHRPDRIALWAVALGAILILLAAMTSSSQAAVRHAGAKPAAAKASHTTVYAPRAATLALHQR